MKSYTANELERESGFDRRTIAYYVQEGLLPKVGRRGRRTRYPQLFLDRLLLIRRVRAAEDEGVVSPVTLSDLGTFFAQVPAGLVAEVAAGRIPVTDELMALASGKEGKGKAGEGFFLRAEERSAKLRARLQSEFGRSQYAAKPSVSPHPPKPGIGGILRQGKPGIIRDDRRRPEAGATQGSHSRDRAAAESERRRAPAAKRDGDPGSGEGKPSAVHPSGRRRPSGKDSGRVGLRAPFEDDGPGEAEADAAGSQGRARDVHDGKSTLGPRDDSLPYTVQDGAAGGWGAAGEVEGEADDAPLELYAPVGSPPPLRPRPKSAVSGSMPPVAEGSPEAGEHPVPSPIVREEPRFLHDSPALDPGITRSRAIHIVKLLAILEARARQRLKESDSAIESWVRIRVSPHIVISVRGLTEKDEDLVRKVRAGVERVVE